MNAIECRGLTKAYQDFTLDDLTFDLPAGCILGLVGENGAGKSTTLKLLMNAIPRDGGQVTVLGADNQSPGFLDTKQDIGVVLDEACFPEVITPKELGKIMGYAYQNWDQSQYEGYLARFRLPLNKKFKDFSRGMKMKLAIAVALSHHPRLLILDEATNGLDPMVRDEILDIFNEFTRQEDHSILISSHIVSDLEKICDYIAFLHKGKLMLYEEKDALYQHYGRLLCSAEDYLTLDPNAVKGKKESPYGVEVIVDRNLIPPQWNLSPVSIEDLFVFMAKEEMR